MTLVAKQKAPNTILHKKRSGKHHARSKEYTKPYWPYLPLLLIVAVALIFSSVWSSRAHHVLGDATTISTIDLLDDTNAQRADNHDAALRESSQLAAAAQTKATDMATRNYWSHDTPDGKTPWTFISTAGYNYRAAGENLAYGFSSGTNVINAWMNSTEHRANLLNKNFVNVGFGIASSENFQNSGPETIVVAMYGEPAITATLASSSNSGEVASATTNTYTPAAITQPPAERISRVQDLAGGTAPWSLLVVSTIGFVAVLWFVIRHALAWKRVIVHSEAFIIRHRFLDLLIVTTAMLGFVLTRTAGMIH